MTECVNFTGLRQWGPFYDNSEKECKICGVKGKYHPTPAPPTTLEDAWNEGYGDALNWIVSKGNPDNPYEGNERVN